MAGERGRVAGFIRVKDLILVAALLAVAGVALWVMSLSRSGIVPTGSVDIFVDGKLWNTVPLGAGDVRVTQESGEENVIRVTENGAYMASSSCRNQLCVQQGEVTTENYAARHLGASIICLPNHVVVTLGTGKGADEAGTDGADGAEGTGGTGLGGADGTGDADGADGGGAGQRTPDDDLPDV